MNEKWMVHNKRADFNEIGEKFQIDPVIARIIRNRDVVGDDQIEAYLHPTLDNLHSGHLLKDADKAAEIIKRAMDEKKKIRIIGDYDIDGIESTYILKKGIQRCGGDVDYAIPRRIEDGYGVNPAMIDQAVEDGVQLIVTCDNGIAAFEAVDCAKAVGMEVVITDHHQLRHGEDENSYVVPRGDAVVNPAQPDCTYPWKGICGAVVAWKLVTVLYERMGYDVKEADCFLENAAVATVGDVMELQGENRTIVTYGLEQLKHTKSPGMQALMAQTGIQIEALSAYHIGFVIGPCLNASGRLDTAVKSMELLEETDHLKAAAKAGELQTLNEERKEMTRCGVEDAYKIIEEQGLEQDKVLVVYLPSLHESLAGIVAGRIKERFNKPTFVIADTGDAREGMAKGSGRSITGYRMSDELQKCDTLLTYFGGHPMAAGCSLPKENIPALREKLNKNITLTEEEMKKKIQIDVPMPLDYIREDLVEQLQLLEPFGNGNPKPVFADKNVRILEGRYIGKNQNFLKLTLKNSAGRIMEALFFGDAEEFRQFVTDKFGAAQWDGMRKGQDNDISVSILYYPQINTYRDKRSLQVVISGYC